MDEIALIRDTINHYGPVFIASLSIQIRRAGVQKKLAVGLVGGAAAAWPFAGRAQQPTLPVIGLISAGSRDTYAELLAAFRRVSKKPVTLRARPLR